MLGEFNAWRPSELSTDEHAKDGSMLWDDPEEEDRGDSVCGDFG